MISVILISPKNTICLYYPLSNPLTPLTPTKVGAQSRKHRTQTHWTPTFVGISGN